MFDIDEASIREGLAAYQSGLTLRGVADRIKAAHLAAEAEYEQTRTQNELPDGDAHNVFRRAENATNSFCLGFADGLLSDIRRMAGRGGTRA